MIRVRVEYVDGSTRETVAQLWRFLPGQGIDRVTVSCLSGERVSESHSLYWLYREGENWVVGEGSVRYDPNPLREVVIEPDGRQTERAIEFLPDLRLTDIKLGWWRPGEAKPRG